MKRGALKIVCVVSLLVCAASSWVWQETYRQQLIVTYVRHPYTYWGINCIEGRLLSWHARQHMEDRPEGWRVKTESRPYQPARFWAGNSWASGWHWMGFIIDVEAPAGQLYRAQTLVVPFWFIASASAVPPMLFLYFAFRRWRRRAVRNICRLCGYNLTGNVSGVCPECGSTVVEILLPPPEHPGLSLSKARE